MADPIKSYVRGQRVRLTLEVQDPAGTYVDPADGPTVFVKKPDGSEQSWTYPDDTEVVRTAVGRFYLDYDSTTVERGTYTSRWEGAEGNHAGADEREFRIKDGRFAPSALGEGSP